MLGHGVQSRDESEYLAKELSRENFQVSSDKLLAAVSGMLAHLSNGVGWEQIFGASPVAHE